MIDYLRESKFLKAISNLLSGGFKDRRFLAKLYYHQDDERQEEKAVDFVDFVLIPDDIVSRKVSNNAIMIYFSTAAE